MKVSSVFTMGGDCRHDDHHDKRRWYSHYDDCKYDCHDDYRYSYYRDCYDCGGGLLGIL